MSAVSFISSASITCYATLFAFAFWHVTLADNYHRYQLLHAIPSSREASLALHNLETDRGAFYDLWREPAHLNEPFHIMVSPRGIGKLHKLCRTYNITLRTVKKDLARDAFISLREASNEDAKSRIRRSVGKSRRHSRYLKYPEIVSTLHAIEQHLPNTKVINIGRTFENRSIAGLMISNNKSLPIIWIDAGIHAREWIAPAASLYIIDKLLGPSGKEMLEKFQFFILPSVNPDGYIFSFQGGRYWRKNRSFHGEENCSGVDLNRNFPYQWGGTGSSSNPCSYTYRGSSPASEPETQSIIRQLKLFRDKLKLYLTVHSYGQLLLTPFGYTKHIYPKNFKQLILLGFRVTSVIAAKENVIYQVGSASELLYEAPGGSDDYVSGELNLDYSYTIELADQGRHGFVLPAAYIRPVGKQLWTALQVFTSSI